MVVLVVEISEKGNGNVNNGTKEAQNGVKEGQKVYPNQQYCDCKNPQEEKACGNDKCACKQSKDGETAKISETKVKDLTSMLQRLQAEFENYQKRNTKQNDEFRTLANAKLIEEILPVLDSLEQGMKHDKALVIVHEQLYSILKKNGVAKIKAEIGMKFNHDRMECLMQENDSKLKEDEVVNVLMEGYELNGKILRLAKVSVNTKNILQNQEEKKVDSIEKK